MTTNESPPEDIQHDDLGDAILDDPALEAELRAFAAEEAARLGLGDRAQYTERINTEFWAADRPHTTLWVSGLTLAQDQFVTRALRGIGYQVDTLEVPDTTAFQMGKEFGNRGQCNPTYFTVGNLIKHLVHLRDVVGMPTAEIVKKYVFLTAGACGPCRFGTYVTEYRKALRDSGFDGFRVLLFQQQGGVKQATGQELGLKIDAKFALAIVSGMMVGDVLNLIGYRMRPYEVEPGSVDRALEECKRFVGAALEENRSVIPALVKSRRLLSKVAIDRTQPKPVVSVIGEFWAMTTEGDGNYKLQRFLEQEGAEVDIQPLTNWLLFILWENRRDTIARMELRQDDEAKKGLSGKDPTKKLWGLAVGEQVVRGLFQTYAHAIGLHGYHLPDMDHIAEIAAPHYDNEVRGGEGHMEVGKLIHFVEDKHNHMTVSVKPFGCMPSSGVSDGVQSLITAKYPDAIFLPLETTGDGEVNALSRVQMMLFKARQKAQAEFDEALAARNLDADAFRTRVKRSYRFRGPFQRPAHRTAGVATNLVYAVR